MPTQALSIAALESSQGGPPTAEPQLVNLRSQVAVVRTLADQVEQLSRAADFDGPGAQMVEEMARLGCRIIDAAAALVQARRTCATCVTSPTMESTTTKRPTIKRYDAGARALLTPRW